MITAIEYPSFQPAMREIVAITNSKTATITTSFAHNYLTGLIVRLDIPLNYDMRQADGFIGPVTRINSTQFSMNLDTTLFDPFMIVVGSSQVAQAVPVGEVTEEIYQATRNVLPDNMIQP